MDWDLGRYETIAAQLLPAARALVEQASPQPGEAVLDVGCGSGTAALLAAEHGAAVRGVDPAARLIDVARAEAAARGIQAEFEVGDAAALPSADRSVDLYISAFGVIFAPDAGAAIAEAARVLAPGGRIALTAWVPGGALGDSVAVRRKAVAAATGEPAGTEPFRWHDPAALEGAFGSHGIGAVVEERELVFTAPSAEAFMETEVRDHPGWVEGRAILSPGEAADARDRALEILETGNEDPDGFRVTSSYVIVTAKRRG